MLTVLVPKSRKTGTGLVKHEKNSEICTSQAKVDTQTRKYTPKLFGRAFDIVLESDNSMRTQAVLRCRT